MLDVCSVDVLLFMHNVSEKYSFAGICYEDDLSIVMCTMAVI